MITSKNTKTALFASLLSIILCVAMLVGSTFAWFTDSVVSGANKIVAGNLDVELEYSTDGTNWTVVAENTNLFKPVEGTTASLWEPGHTEYVYLRVRNAGTLALKYQLSVDAYSDVNGTPEKTYTNKENEYFKLSDYLVLKKIDGTAVTDRKSLWIADVEEEKAAMGKLDGLDMDGVLSPNTTGKAFTLAVYMPTQVGNEANQLTAKKETEGEPTVFLGLKLVATQTPEEKDSFGNDYDHYAVYPDATVVKSVEELTNKINNADDGDVIALTGDMTLENAMNINKDITIYGNGMTIEKQPVYVSPDNTVTFMNVNFADTTATDKASSVYGSDFKGTMVFDGCKFGDNNWESIQITPKGDATIIIRNCTFTATKNIKRFIHIQPASGNNYKLNIVIENCTFVGCELVNYSGSDVKSVIDLDYIAVGSTMHLGGCTFTNTDGTECADAHAYFCTTDGMQKYNYSDMYSKLTGEVQDYVVE